MSKRPQMQKRIDHERLDQFAEMLAEGMGSGKAAAALGLCPQRGSQLLKMIREGLGWQAI